jgi:flagellar hook-associated protein 3 FlgL
VRTTVIAAGNATLSDSDRQSMAQDIAGRLEQLLGSANATNPAGGYLFGGYSDGAPPFAKVGGAVVYNGDQGGRSLQVSESRAIEVSTNGSSIFERVQSTSGTQSIFATLQNLVNLLNAPANSAALISGLADAITNIDNAHDRVLAVRSSMGSRMQEIEGLQNAASARDTMVKGQLSQLEDVDYAAAISTLSRQQLVLEAAQKSYVGVTHLSLFNLL